MSFLQDLWKGSGYSPGSDTTPERPPRHPDPSILLPMGAHRGSPQPSHRLPCPADEGAALPLSPVHQTFHQQHSRPIARGGAGIPPISGKNPGAPSSRHRSSWYPPSLTGVTSSPAAAWVPAPSPGRAAAPAPAGARGARPSHPFPGAHLPGSLALRFQNCLPLSAAMAEGRGGAGPAGQPASERAHRPAGPAARRRNAEEGGDPPQAASPPPARSPRRRHLGSGRGEDRHWSLRARRCGWANREREGE